MAVQLRSPLLAQTTLPSCLLFLLLVSSSGRATATATATAAATAGELTVVWGRNKAEGSLREACDAGLYATVIISFLRVSGHGRYSTDLSGHDVSAVGADVKHCQTAKNVTVLLSVAGSRYNYSSPGAARHVADHLWNAFLGGSRRGVRRPFGDDAVLDGVDFYLDGGAEQERFSDLVRRRLLAIRRNNGGAANKKVRVTATTPCSRVIDADMGGGGELGLFERLHVRFYGEARCGYDYHETRPFWGAWHMWVARFPAARLLVGLPATDGVRGWIDPTTLRDSVLPSVQDDSNYGGLMLWDRYHDKITGYSRAAIEP